MKKTLILDFDGTLADSLPVLVGAVNGVAERFGYQEISEKDIEQLRSKTVMELKDFFSLSIFQIPFFLAGVRKLFYENVGRLEPVLGMPDALHELKKEGVRLGCLTSNTQDLVEDFLGKYYENLFDFVEGGVSIFGKARELERVMKEKELEKQECVYVGDEIRDVLAAQAVGVRMWAVVWGLNSEEALRARQPDRVVTSPMRLVEACRRI
jgi:phosphoglycolate phosphatase